MRSIFVKLNKLTLGSKIILGAIGTITALSIVSIWLQNYIIEEQGTELVRDQMRNTVLQAEAVRDNMSQMWQKGAVDQDTLLADYEDYGKERLEESEIYSTIPVIASWQTIEEIADEEGYEFRIPREQPRNPENLPTDREQDILAELEEAADDEFFEVNSERNEIVYARSIRLTEDCMVCHGDPSNSPTGDGRDMLGYEMEGWEVGEAHGAFLLRTDMDTIDQVSNRSTALLILLLLPVIAVAIGGFYILNRIYILNPFRNFLTRFDGMLEHTDNASDEIKSSSGSLADSANNQAASLEQISASVKELRTLSTDNRESAEQGQKVIASTKDQTSVGVDKMEAMNQSMQQISEASHRSSKMLKEIDDIAMQTNLLALNASVEAARAGEAGEGFAVVAEEIRSLAVNVSDIAKRIAEHTNNTIQKTDRGVEESEEVRSLFVEMNERVQKLYDASSGVAQKANDQDKAIEEINSAMEQLERKTQTVASSSEEHNSIANEMRGLVQQVRDNIEHLKKMMIG